MPQPDLIDCAFALGAMEVDCKHLKRQFVHADECGAGRSQMLRAHLGDLHRLRHTVDCLIAEAEVETIEVEAAP